VALHTHKHMAKVTRRKEAVEPINSLSSYPHIWRTYLVVIEEVHDNGRRDPVTCEAPIVGGQRHDPSAAEVTAPVPPWTWGLAMHAIDCLDAGEKGLEHAELEKEERKARGVGAEEPGREDSRPATHKRCDLGT
jgi:hypothetical protein